MFRKARLLAFASVLLLMALTPAALANEGNGKAKGHDKGAPPASVWTEDNDTNDGGTPNNVADAGDNAHPSGKDRSVESGNSGNQGNAASHPDDSKGPKRFEGELGADKPNGPGGRDLADQDGNNGCGNDDDFDDDNNGWCGRKPKGNNGGGNNGGGNNGGGNNGGGNNGGNNGGNGGSNTGGSSTSTTPTVVLSAGGTSPQATQVLGVKYQAAAIGGDVLPRTGIDWAPILVMAVAFLMVGSLIEKTTRKSAQTA
jgi:hypothetical protein